MDRIWDKYLSQRDRRHIAQNAPWPSVEFGTKPLLLLVDNYRAALGERPLPFFESVKEYPWSTGEEGWRAVERTAELLDRFRTGSLPVAHVTSVHPSDGIPQSYESIHNRKLTRPDDGAFHEIVPLLAPAPGEAIFRKTGSSAFHGTSLIAYLNHLDIDTLVVCGETTSGCVRASVTDAASYCFKVFIVEDCVYDRHETSHAISLFDMHMKYGCVLPLQELIRYIPD